MRLTRSQVTVIDKELLNFCLNETVRDEYNFCSLEAYVLSFFPKEN